MSLSWGAVDGVSGYIIEMLSNGTWSQVMSVDSSQTSAMVSNLSSYTTYRFRVKSYVNSGEVTVYSEQSNEVATLTDYSSASATSNSGTSSSASASTSAAFSTSSSVKS
ncbi:MAG: fibronectin type III domain-containing protein [Clostridiales bacterium]|nr:fibronectin type III domain-containing protein [Clostridiales bacterium]